MARSVYFDTSVFIELTKKGPAGKTLRELMAELSEERLRIYTSIITIEEMLVAVYRRGGKTKDVYGDVGRFARIYTINKEIAIEAARREAEIKDLSEQEQTRSKKPTPEQELERICENRRRRWDCFHIATAQVLNCRVLYTADRGLLGRESQLSLKDIRFSKPAPTPATIKGPLFGGSR
jgi:predicted nucleic acid-binding protein